MSVQQARAELTGRAGTGRAPALVDRAVLARLIGDCGADVVDLVIDGFGEEAADGLTALRAAIEACDATAAERALHGLRGGAMALGFDRLVEAVRQAELAAREGTLPDAATIAALDDLVSRSLAALRDIRAQGIGPA